MSGLRSNDTKDIGLWYVFEERDAKYDPWQQLFRMNRTLVEPQDANTMLSEWFEEKILW